MPKKRGGKRPGAGRKKGSKSKTTIEQQEALAFLREMIREKWGPLIQAEIDLASGLYVFKFIKVKTEKGEIKKRVKVYRRPPSHASIESLLAKVIGKTPPPPENDDPREQKVDQKELESFIKWRKQKKKKKT